LAQAARRRWPQYARAIRPRSSVRAIRRPLYAEVRSRAFSSLGTCRGGISATGASAFEVGRAGQPLFTSTAAPPASLELCASVHGRRCRRRCVVPAPPRHRFRLPHKALRVLQHKHAKAAASARFVPDRSAPIENRVPGAANTIFTLATPIGRHITCGKERLRLVVQNRSTPSHCLRSAGRRSTCGSSRRAGSPSPSPFRHPN